MGMAIGRMYHTRHMSDESKRDVCNAYPMTSSVNAMHLSEFTPTERSRRMHLNYVLKKALRPDLRTDNLF